MILSYSNLILNFILTFHFSRLYVASSIDGTDAGGGMMYKPLDMYSHTDMGVRMDENGNTGTGIVGGGGSGGGGGGMGGEAGVHDDFMMSPAGALQKIKKTRKKIAQIPTPSIAPAPILTATTIQQ